MQGELDALRAELPGREAVSGLRFWMAEMSRVQMDAARVVAVRRLIAEAPRPPVSSDYSRGGAPRGAEQLLRPWPFGAPERRDDGRGWKACLEPALSCLVNNPG